MSFHDRQKLNKGISGSQGGALRTHSFICNCNSNAIILKLPTRYGDTRSLLSRKRHFSDDISSNVLGSPPGEQLLCRLKPRYWFAAHLHCKFSALVEHPESDKYTRFLALDKCLPRRDYLQFLDIEPTSDHVFIDTIVSRQLSTVENPNSSPTMKNETVGESPDLFPG
ncbi:unnamed protein product [Protopolystoma xenopodis]|uniref:Lariat debranching enzyme C-terminal domain-containing protein n=1 Tax=Protopolystoma xenopodis TaxID=117903 RepID=A0A3S5CNU7_9PLAT|nr:unnamed protein product [Protopolystoma xenopodis]